MNLIGCLIYNCYINEASQHSLFEVAYGFQLATATNRLLPPTGELAHVAGRLTSIANSRDVVRDILTLLNHPIFLFRMIVYSSLRTYSF